MSEQKTPDKINEFMNGLIKYIQDKEKKHEKDLRELEKQVEIELKQKREDARKAFLLKDKNKDFKRQLDDIATDIKRWTGRIEELKEKKSTVKQTEEYSELIEKHKNTREILLRQIDRKIKKKINKKILEQELLPNETHNPDCDANPEGKNCPIMG